MSRQGPRPHTWIIQGVRAHDQYISWQRAKAQANFRGEEWCLTFEQYQSLWDQHWEQRGRGIDDYIMTRDDMDGVWREQNIIIIPRHEHLKRMSLFKEQKRKRNGKARISLYQNT